MGSSVDRHPELQRRFGLIQTLLRWHQPRLAAAFGLLSFLLFFLVWVDPASAVNGLFNARGNHQEGRTGDYAFSSDNLHLTSSFDQNIRLFKGLTFRTSFLSTWETRDNRVGTATSEFDEWRTRPQFSLNFSESRFRTGWSWYGMRAEQRSQGTRIYRDDRFDNSLYAILDMEHGTLESRWQGSSAERDEVIGLRENRDRRWHSSARIRVSDSDQVQYDYSNSSNHSVTLGSKSIYERHNLEYQGHRRFAGERGQISASARSTYFRQRTEQEIAGSWEFVEPDWSGFVLDDTPEFHDPLEAAPVMVAALSDNVLDSSTGINIGNSAELVREFGGDYCNLIVDFGAAEEIVAANLFIDTRLVLPDLIQWMVFENDDPDGTEWGSELGADQVTVTYREWANGRQGWEFRFTDPISPRRLKLVDFKLGVTESDIFINELEVFRAVDAEQLETSSTSHRHRFNGSAAFEIRENLHVSYGVTVDLRRFEQDARNSTGVGQSASVDWIKGGWIIAGKLQDSQRKRKADTDTDMNSQTISLAPQRKGSLNTRFSAGRSHDESQGRDQSTYNVTSETNWKAAPRLSFSQRIGYGFRDDRAGDVNSHSWALISRMRSSPRRSVRFDLTRRDRWVSQEAGSGFMTFNDTEGLVAWSVTSQISASSRIRYQVREEGEWVLRHFLSWSPIPGGNLEMRLFMNGFRDTRNDSSQRGQGVSVTWQPRSRLFLEGAYNVSNYSQGDEESSPTNLSFRGTWSF